MPHSVIKIKEGQRLRLAGWKEILRSFLHRVIWLGHVDTVNKTTVIVSSTQEMNLHHYFKFRQRNVH